MSIYVCCQSTIEYINTLYCNQLYTVITMKQAGCRSLPETDRVLLKVPHSNILVYGHQRIHNGYGT